MIGWQSAGFAVIGSVVGRPGSPGSLLGWGLMMSLLGGDCWLGLVCNDSVGINKVKHQRTNRRPVNVYTLHCQIIYSDELNAALSSGP